MGKKRETKPMKLTPRLILKNKEKGTEGLGGMRRQIILVVRWYKNLGGENYTYIVVKNQRSEIPYFTETL